MIPSPVSKMIGAHRSPSVTPGGMKKHSRPTPPLFSYKSRREILEAARQVLERQFRTKP